MPKPKTVVLSREAERDMTCGLAAVRLRDLLTAHWAELRSIAEDHAYEDPEQAKVNATIVLDFGGATPSGSVKIAFARRVTDDAQFRCDDPTQPGLPLGEEGE